MTELYGYADPLGITAGGAVDFMLSADDPTTVEVSLVRLIHGDTNPLGPGFIEEVVAADLPSAVLVRRQETQRGAFIAVDDAAGVLADPQAATLYAFICPSRPGGVEQVIVGRWDETRSAGYLLLIDVDGRLRLRLGGGGKLVELALSKRLAPGCWFFVAGGWDAAAGKATLHQSARINRWNSRIGPVAPFEMGDAKSFTGEITVVTGASADFIIAGVRGPGEMVERLYNGKIDRPGVQKGCLDPNALEALGSGEAPPPAGMVARWDTSLGYTENGVDNLFRDVGPSGLHSLGVNRPIRGMTGWNWTGKDDCFRLNPSQYGGVAFHDDALIDCRWNATVRFQTPKDLKSGVYALRVRGGGGEDHVPFFVRPDRPRARVAVLMSTFTYLAYANEHLSFEAPIAQAICANTPVVTPSDIYWKAQEEFGLSTYDVHSDYAGVCYSSWRRPIINMRPRYRMPAAGTPWAFPADLSLLWWLEHSGYDFDILTDHDLHREGVAALKPYSAVLTCSHPEYCSRTMLDATEDYLGAGGRVLYLGGNGYYWVTNPHDDEPWCMEVRKLDTGSRAWQAAPGEGYLASTGERSGLWRSRGRPPQKVVGVGFTTEGMDESRPFDRLPDSHNPKVAWIFEGLAHDELIGDFGLGLGGAAGLEMDRYDLALGTPPHALLLAASFGHSDNYPLVSEEVSYAFPGRGGTQDPQVRSDIVFFTTPNHGAVFSAGSIAWSQALPCKDGDNNVARVLKNVLDVFSARGPIPNFE